MKVWYDTEFLDRGGSEPVVPISVGMVREDGAELYLVNGDLDSGRLSIIRNDPWLGPNVYEHLPTVGNRLGLDYDHPDVVSLKEMASRVSAFCVPRGEEVDGVRLPLDGERAELWAYYADYDHVVLSQLFGRMVDLPAHMPMYTRDLKQLIDWCAVDPRDLPPQPADAHHALADARWVRDACTAVFRNLGRSVELDTRVIPGSSANDLCRELLSGTCASRLVAQYGAWAVLEDADGDQWIGHLAWPYYYIDRSAAGGERSWLDHMAEKDWTKDEMTDIGLALGHLGWA